MRKGRDTHECLRIRRGFDRVCLPAVSGAAAVDVDPYVRNTQAHAGAFVGAIERLAAQGLCSRERAVTVMYVRDR